MRHAHAFSSTQTLGTRPGFYRRFLKGAPSMQSKAKNSTELRPAAEEALRRGISRERLVRLIQRGQVSGERIGANWFVHTSDAPANSGKAA